MQRRWGWTSPGWFSADIWRSSEQPPTEQILDDLASRLMTAVRAGRSRLFVDGIGGYVEAADQLGRVSHVFTALANELRAQGATTVYAGETNNLVGPEVTVPVEGISAIVENLVLLRFAEYRRFTDCFPS